MCHEMEQIYSEGIESGMEKGIEKGEMIMNMHRKGYTAAQIADVAGMREEQIEDIIKLELQST